MNQVSEAAKQAPAASSKILLKKSDQ